MGFTFRNGIRTSKGGDFLGLGGAQRVERISNFESKGFDWVEAKLSTRSSKEIQTARNAISEARVHGFWTPALCSHRRNKLQTSRVEVSVGPGLATGTPNEFQASRNTISSIRTHSTGQMASCRKQVCIRSALNGLTNKLEHHRSIRGSLLLALTKINWFDLDAFSRGPGLL